MSKVIPFPDEAQQYLERKFGLRPYSPRHAQRLAKAGRFPKPLEISPRRFACLVSDLDEYGERITTPE